MIGYFPTYTIGNLMAAQLWGALAEDLDPPEGNRDAIPGSAMKNT